MTDAPLTQSEIQTAIETVSRNRDELIKEWAIRGRVSPLRYGQVSHLDADIAVMQQLLATAPASVDMADSPITHPPYRPLPSWVTETQDQAAYFSGDDGA